jgi:hypothetical protein
MARRGARGGHSARVGVEQATQSDRSYLVADKKRPQEPRFAFDCEQHPEKLNVNGGAWSRRSVPHSDQE